MSFSSDTNEQGLASPEQPLIDSLSLIDQKLENLSITNSPPTTSSIRLRDSSPSSRNQFRPEWKPVCTYESLDVTKYTFISYNVLAQAHLDSMLWLYRKNQKRHLLWEYRFIKLTNFFETYPASIYCLQEVQNDHLQLYKHYFQQQQDKLCLYEQRPGGKPDGCLIAYDPVAFTLRDHFRVDFDHEAPVSGASTNVGQIAVLQVNAFQQEEERVILIVVNTHIVYSPKAGHVKLWQICKLLEQIRFVKELYKDCQLSIVFSGDFNSVPKSGLWDLVTDGRLDIRNHNRLTISGQKSGNASLINSLPDDTLLPLQSSSDRSSFEHDLQLSAAYSPSDCHKHYTQTDSNGLVVDHIFYSGLRILERLSLWPLRDFTESALPGSVYGSDHMPVGVQFEVVELEEGEILD